MSFRGDLKRPLGNGLHDRKGGGERETDLYLASLR